MVVKAKGKKEYESSIYDSGIWYKVPDYRIMLIREGRTTNYKDNVSCPEDIVRMFRLYLDAADREICVVAFLDVKKNILGLHTVSIGTLDTSLVHPREVFKAAIVIGASSIILAHNHPTGDCRPSYEDNKVTERMKEAGKLLGIELIDHIIIGDGFYSFKGDDKI